MTVLERRGVVGGAAVTEEFHPGFRNSVAAYTVSLLQPKVIRDLDLHAHGLKIVERKASNFLPRPDGTYLLTGAQVARKQEVAKFSKADAQRLPEYELRLDIIADVLRELAARSTAERDYRRLVRSAAGTDARGQTWQALGGARHDDAQ